nr:immunoglobulin heavy chain junction region [Mus musculus]MBK4187292.1 immunoglobulin heavy chain junction region [Mus musculus]MBK4195242.1 immunoglobulin heavy chain junction region [Mus musculus]MBK4196122.1 immunoglobulin heavy chain junction region [Mus musculus]MBK4196871.1 immunoglobulin heavy chain junction region [Mus musculus]
CAQMKVGRGAMDYW